MPQWLGKRWVSRFANGAAVCCPSLRAGTRSDNQIATCVEHERASLAQFFNASDQENIVQGRRILTRTELFDLVWSKPIKELAIEFGVSDRGLAKICGRHRIATPDRGYWQKLAAGKPVIRVTMEHTTGTADRIEIRSTVGQLPDAAREAIDAAKRRREQAKGTTREPLSTDGPARAKLHESIRATAQALRRSKPDRWGGVVARGDGLCGISVAHANIERAIPILDELTWKLEAAGLQLVPVGNGLKVSLGQETATFAVKERTHQRKHVVTPEDSAAEERRQKRLQRYWNMPNHMRQDDDGLFGRAYPEWDTIYTGELALQVEGYADGVRRKWADGKTQKLEKLLDDAVIGIGTLLAVRKAQREAREERSRQYEEEARARELAKRYGKREEQRRACLKRLIERHREIEEIRQWLAHVGPLATGCTDDFSRMVTWARSWLEHLVKATEPAAVSEELQQAGLFPEDGQIVISERDAWDRDHW